MIKKFFSSGFTSLSVALGLVVAAGLKSPNLGFGLLAWYGFLALFSMSLWIAAEGMKDTPKPFLKGTVVSLHIGNAFVPLILYMVFGSATLNSVDELCKAALVETAAVALPLFLGSALYNKLAGGTFTARPLRFMFA